MAKIALGECSLENQMWYISKSLAFLGCNIFNEKWMQGFRLGIDGLLMVMYLVLQMYASTVGVVSYVFMQEEISTNDMVGAIVLTASQVNDIVKIMWLVVYRKDLLEIVSMAQSQNQTMSAEDQIVNYETMREVKGMSLKISTYIMVSVLGVTIILAIASKGQGALSKSYLYGLEPQNESPNKELSYFIALHMAFSMTVCKCAFMILFLSLLGHCRAHLKILSLLVGRLANVMEENISRNKHSGIKDENIEIKYFKLGEVVDIPARRTLKMEMLRDCVDNHNIILNMTVKINHVYEIILTLEVAFILTALCLALIVPDKVLIMVLLNKLITIFLYCYSSQAFTDENENLFKSIYMTNWYNVHPKDRQILNFMLLMSSKPLHLTIGKMVVLTMKTFQNTINLAYSSYTMVKTSLGPRNNSV